MDGTIIQLLVYITIYDDGSDKTVCIDICTVVIEGDRCDQHT